MKAFIAFEELVGFMIALAFLSIAFMASQKLFLTHSNIGEVMEKCNGVCFEGFTTLSKEELTAYNITVEGEGKQITLLKTPEGFIARLS